jgi:D-serine deaminase-like pyridoxal phosphate-dependent protein
MLSTVSCPRVVVDLPTLRANIAAMQALANGAGVRLRPHSKTHKSPVIAQWQVAAGAVGICCAKLGEAEVMAEAGVPDIRVPYPVHPSNAGRVIALLDRTTLSIVVDDLQVARAWSSKMLLAGRQLDVLVKVDVGFHRCGVDPDAPEVADTIRQIAGLGGLNFRGLLSHAGHGYAAASADELARIALQEIAILNGLAARLHDAGVGPAEISVGATPTARFVPSQTGVTEMRPGNYVFFDRTQVGLEAARIDQCALTVMSMVVSRPAPDRIIFDAGSKMLTSDGARGFGAAGGHGLVFPSLDASAPDLSIVVERLSEEHAIARVPTSCPLRVGDRVRIVPNHSCVVTNLTDELLLADGTEVIDRIRVAARGRTQ